MIHLAITIYRRNFFLRIKRNYGNTEVCFVLYSSLVPILDWCEATTTNLGELGILKIWTYEVGAVCECSARCTHAPHAGPAPRIPIFRISSLLKFVVVALRRASFTSMIRFTKNIFMEFDTFLYSPNGDFMGRLVPYDPLFTKLL